MTTELLPITRLRRWLEKLTSKSNSPLDDQAAVENAYARWAPVYDWVFTAPLWAGQRAAAREANRHSGRLLEVGVGTGLSLPRYGNTLKVTGIDLSRPMLKYARERVARKALCNVEDLQAMDAAKMSFDDARFDVATVMYVMTVVPEPSKVLAEVGRVVRSGGTVIIVNHFAAETGPLAWIEKSIARFSASLGWDPLFQRDVVLANTNMTLVREERLAPFGLFTMMVFQRP